MDQALSTVTSPAQPIFPFIHPHRSGRMMQKKSEGQRSSPPVMEESSLNNWESIGAGGFGKIYKARHCQLCCDVAIKLLYDDDGDGASLLREVGMMRQAVSPFVVQVWGVFKGRPPFPDSSIQLGLVMEFMERGSLASLQKALNGALPWPLVIRLAYQVAMGINFLHCLSPPLLHLDLTPNNVLLDSALNAKLADFGLARNFYSKSQYSKKEEDEKGVISYMPPEAFSLSYHPTSSFDIYSYSMLLWSIITGKPPYQNPLTSLVKFRIPRGDRPSLDLLNGLSEDRKGLEELVELMKSCWSGEPTERPSAKECTIETEKLYKNHKDAILDTVHDLLKTLDQKGEDPLTEQVQRVHISQISGGAQAAKTYDALTRRPVQEVADDLTPHQRGKAKDDPPTPQHASLCVGDAGWSSTGSKMKASSVCPIIAPSQLPPTRGSAQDSRTANTPLDRRQSDPAEYQVSSPHTPTYHPPPAQPPQHPAGGFSIHLSSAVGIQVGNNNHMHIGDRRRHPTAPPHLSLSNSGSRKKKTGGAD
ncbi:receptor-interacting serine/threonine-protein kinase 3 isoform 2-T3 [Aulostomus maculatus]